MTGELRVFMPGLFSTRQRSRAVGSRPRLRGRQLLHPCAPPLPPRRPFLEFRYRDSLHRGLTDIGWEDYPEGFTTTPLSRPSLRPPGLGDRERHRRSRRRAAQHSSPRHWGRCSGPAPAEPARGYLYWSFARQLPSGWRAGALASGSTTSSFATLERGLTRPATTFAGSPRPRAAAPDNERLETKAHGGAPPLRRARPDRGSSAQSGAGSRLPAPRRRRIDRRLSLLKRRAAASTCSGCIQLVHLGAERRRPRRPCAYQAGACGGCGPPPPDLRRRPRVRGSGPAPPWHRSSRIGRGAAYAAWRKIHGLPERAAADHHQVAAGALAPSAVASAGVFTSPFPMARVIDRTWRRRSAITRPVRPDRRVALWRGCAGGAPPAHAARLLSAAAICSIVAVLRVPAAADLRRHRQPGGLADGTTIAAARGGSQSRAEPAPLRVHLLHRAPHVHVDQLGAPLLRHQPRPGPSPPAPHRRSAAEYGPLDLRVVPRGSARSGRWRASALRADQLRWGRARHPSGRPGHERAPRSPRPSGRAPRGSSTNDGPRRSIEPHAPYTRGPSPGLVTASRMFSFRAASSIRVTVHPSHPC